MQCFLLLLVERNRRCNFYYFLVAPLHRAVTLKQVHHTAGTVAEQLHFDMLGLFDKAFNEHFTAAKRCKRLSLRLTEFIGKWSMIDVFVVAILAALVHLGGLLVIRPGIAALSFAGVVIVTMIAAESFDPRLIWDNMEDGNNDD